MTISMAYFTKRGKKIFYFLQKNAVWRRTGMKTVGVVRLHGVGKRCTFVVTFVAFAVSDTTILVLLRW